MVHPDKFLGDRQTDSATLVQYRIGDIGLEEAFEYLVAFVGRDADAGIFYPDGKNGLIAGRLRGHIDAYSAVGRREFECVGKEIEQNAFNFVVVEGGAERFVVAVIMEGDVFAFGEVNKGIRDFPDEFKDIAMAGMEALTRLPPFCGSRGVGLRGGGGGGRCGGSFRIGDVGPGGGWNGRGCREWVRDVEMRDVGAGKEFFHGGKDQGQGGSQFVAHVGEEPDLHQVDLVQPFGLAAFLFEGEARPGFPDNHPVGR